MEKSLLVSFKEDEYERESSTYVCCFSFLGQKVMKFGEDVLDFALKAWEMGRSDPRKVIFAIKMGLALSIVSSLIFWKESFHHIDIGQYSIWAILTVIVMFEFSIGGTFIKGFNRGLGTLVAGILAFCFAEVSLLAGNLEEVVIVISVFIVGFFASYLKLYPTMKPYEYGFRVFILTYCILMVAGNRTREYNGAVTTRLVLIVVGAAVCLFVNICICPIWSGEDLHNLVVKNFKEVATSLEGCVDGYLKFVEYERTPSKILTYQASDDSMHKGYKSVMESKSQEETLAPAEKRLVFCTELRWVGAEGAKVLRELGKKIEKMEKLGPGDILKDVHEAAEKLQKSIDHRSYILVNSENWEIGRRPRKQEGAENVSDYKDSDDMKLGLKSLSETVLDLRSVSAAWTPSATQGASSECVFRNQPAWPFGVGKEENCTTYESASALSLATFVSLLIEFVARLQNVVDSFEELGEKAKFTS
ncbi:hypothetical protein ACLB2K_039323 [Fragaria x ananassa]